MSDQEKMRDWHSLFEYSNGRLIWKYRPAEHFFNSRTHHRFNTLYAGKEAGNINKGYREVFLGKQRIGIHRIIFAMHHGRWPSMIDHIDGNPLNNLIENLRECTPTQNQYNKRTAINSSSGIKGVHWNPSANKWQANIRINGRLKHLGTFDNKADAISARRNAAIQHHGEFVNHG